MTGGGGDCPAAIFLDGIRIKVAAEYTVDRRGRMTNTQRDGAISIDDYVQPTEVAGLEIYPRAMLAPPLLQPVADYARDEVRGRRRLDQTPLSARSAAFLECTAPRAARSRRR